MINLLLIDPHPAVRCGFENFLYEYNFLNVVHTAENLADGIAFTKSNPVDIVISEMILNDESSLDLIHQIKNINPEINVIFLLLKTKTSIVFL